MSSSWMDLRTFNITIQISICHKWGLILGLFSLHLVLWELEFQQRKLPGQDRMFCFLLKNPGKQQDWCFVPVPSRIKKNLGIEWEGSCRMQRDGGYTRTWLLAPSGSL